MKPRPRHIPLTDAQEKDLQRLNLLFLECSRSFYASPEQSPAIGEKYWGLLGISEEIMVSSLIEEPWFPGALAAFPADELLERPDLIVINPEVLDGVDPIIGPYMTVAVVKPEIDQVRVVSRKGNHNLIQLEPLQNLHVMILAGEDDDEEPLPGVKEINLNEDYQYVMVNPEIVENFLVQPPAPKKAASFREWLRGLARIMPGRR